jgi:uncharacterized membrane protein
MATTSARAAALVAALVVAVVMAPMMAAGPASAAETYKGKGNGYGRVKNNGGAFPGGGSCEGCDVGCGPF